MLLTRAPAKINLTLHVRRRRADGYHELESLVAFAGASDILSLVPGPGFALSLSGPTAVAAGGLDDNLVLRAARALAGRKPNLAGGTFHLLKRLPVGAGVGGGSSDAAAALRLLAALNGLSLDDADLRESARVTGADVPVCVEPRCRVMRGIGEQLDRPLALAGLYALLVNPGVHLETRLVFATMGLAPGEERPGTAHPVIEGPGDPERWIRRIAEGRNDMQPAALSLAPVIGDVLTDLFALPGCRLARMSGSGSTCFGLFTDRAALRAAARRLKAQRPGWWIVPTPLR